RLLQIASHKGSIRVRLVSTTHYTFVPAPYLVLSHCWGQVNPYCKTTEANFNAYFDSIPFQTLLPTFAEAIVITHQLGLKYLWVDSLCIVQNDSNDWEKEAAKMAGIFREAFLTTSASDSHNCYSGCGIQNVWEPSTVLHLRLEDREQTCWVRNSATADMSKLQFERSPLHKRGWIFQERLLSCRILHVLHGQLVWQCAAIMETEDGLNHQYFPHQPDDPNPQGWKYDGYLHPSQELQCLDSHWLASETASRVHKMPQLWWDWVKDFTARQFTKPSDNYAALAGVVGLYRELAKDEPLLGLCKKTI
ncbi:HET-domain-containing protein, partial [Lentithecium fluviatile CBS 122367]